MLSESPECYIIIISRFSKVFILKIGVLPFVKGARNSFSSFSSAVTHTLVNLVQMLMLGYSWLKLGIQRSLLLSYFCLDL